MRDSVAKQRLLSLDIRFGHLESAATTLHFAAALKQLRAWLMNERLFAEFLKRHDDAKQQRLSSIAQHIGKHQHNALSIVLALPDTFDEQLATILAALDAATVWSAPPVPKMAAQLGHDYTPLQLALMALGYATRDGKSADETLALLRSQFLCLKDHLREYIGIVATATSLLHRYKERSELFRTAVLRDIADKASVRKEAALAIDLYTYLHDMGINFSIEPASASGEPDLVSVVEEDRRIVLDVKYVYEKNEAKRTVLKGFRQVLDYCRDFSEPSGFLVIYLNADLRFDIRSDDGFGGVKLGDNIIHVCIVDIFDNPLTASKRSVPNVIEVSPSDLVALVHPPLAQGQN